MIKINRLEIENVKKIKATKIIPANSGLTVIGGKNGQGKTSVLDAIAWALGGERYRPSQSQRAESVLPPYIHIVLSNGLVVERKGKNSELKVTDPEGRRAGQQLLNDFVEELALNLPKFMQQGGRDKANTLLKIIGVGEKLYELEKREQELYNRRRAIGQIADQKKKFAKEMPYDHKAPKELVSISELIKQQQDILARNGRNQALRDHATALLRLKNDLERQLDELQKKYEDVCSDYDIAQKSASDLQDESTVELEANIANIEQINRRVRANLDKDKAEEEAQEYQNEYDTLTNAIDDIRQAKKDLLKSADLPLDGLAVENGELLYNGYRWDSMSGSDQLKVATAIVRRLNPKCGFVLLDKLEQMDLETLREFGLWLEKEGLQAIATRVSTGDECSIIIEDGQSAYNQNVQMKSWKEGEF